MEKEIFFQFNSAINKKVVVVSFFVIHQPTVWDGTKCRVKEGKYIQRIYPRHYWIFNYRTCPSSQYTYCAHNYTDYRRHKKGLYIFGNNSFQNFHLYNQKSVRPILVQFVIIFILLRVASPCAGCCNIYNSCKFI